MDVDVRISLQGGHVWEFTCEEDDPIVYGLVSSLPGLGVDPNLPPDGLIQVESRAGHRLYFTRGNLVGVTIMPKSGAVGKGGPIEPVALRGEGASGLMLLVPNLLRGADVEGLVAAVRASGGVGISAEIIPPSAAQAMAERMAGTAAALGLAPFDGGVLDAALDALQAPAALDLPTPDTNDLSLLFHLPSGTSDHRVRIASVNADGPAPELLLPGNCGLIAFGGGGRRISLDAADGSSLVVSGVVRRGP